VGYTVTRDKLAPSPWPRLDRLFSLTPTHPPSLLASSDRVLDPRRGGPPWRLLQKDTRRRCSSEVVPPASVTFQLAPGPMCSGLGWGLGGVVVSNQPSSRRPADVIGWAAPQTANHVVSWFYQHPLATRNPRVGRPRKGRRGQEQPPPESCKYRAGLPMDQVQPPLPCARKTKEKTVSPRPRCRTAGRPSGIWGACARGREPDTMLSLSVYHGSLECHEARTDCQHH